MSGKIVRAVHEKLKYGNGVRCPRCGYEPTPGELLSVWDRVDVSAKVELGENGRLGNPCWETARTGTTRKR